MANFFGILLFCFFLIIPLSASENQVEIDHSLEQARQTIQKLNSIETSGGPEKYDSCMTLIINNSTGPRVLGADQVKIKIDHIPSGIRPAFSGADVHVSQAAFATLNGYNLTRLLHDSGQWPAWPGSANTDDGIADGNNLPGTGEDGQTIDEQAGEIYDLDGNNHYPAAVLRALGSRCYVFVPVYMFPTLPGSIDQLQRFTPPAPALSRLFWVDSAAVLGKTLFWSPTVASSSALLEPRFLFGADKNSATQKMQQMANEFDSLIYPRISDAFGNPPDIDRDPRIYLLVDDIRDGSGNFRGYFYSNDQLPKSVDGFSNAKELLYIDAFPSLSLIFNDTMGTVAHEFVHLITFNENGKKNEERWIDEGMANVGRNLYDGTESTNVDAFIKKPDISLVSNDQEEFLGPNAFAHYGNSYLFSLYLVEKYGRGNPNGFIRKVIGDDAQGVSGINNALRDQNVTFEDVFKTWVIANHLDKTRRIDGTELHQGLWGYNFDNDTDTTNDIGTNEHLPVKTSESKIVGEKSPLIVSASVSDTAADYIKITGSPGDLTVNFDGENEKVWEFAIIKKSDTVDPDVERYTLDQQEKSGSKIIKNFGTGNTFKELIFVPGNLSISGGAANAGGQDPVPETTTGQLPYYQTEGDQAPVVGKIAAALQPTGHYVISGSFNNMIVSVWPNPVHENELLVAVKSKNGFSQVPTGVITFGGVQRQLILSGITNDTYLANFTIKDSGEGNILATGEDQNGLLLRSNLNFSANHMNDRIPQIPYRNKIVPQNVNSTISLSLNSGSILKGIEFTKGNSLAFFQFTGPVALSSEDLDLSLNGKEVKAIYMGNNRFKLVLKNKLISGKNRLNFRYKESNKWTALKSIEIDHVIPLEFANVGYPGKSPEHPDIFSCKLAGDKAGDVKSVQLIIFDMGRNTLKEVALIPRGSDTYSLKLSSLLPHLKPGSYRFRLCTIGSVIELRHAGIFIVQ
ncbi:hypothetical protein ACFL35_08170 [Candidatus Riflebacteria bacterium]